MNLINSRVLCLYELFIWNANKSKLLLSVLYNLPQFIRYIFYLAKLINILINKKFIILIKLLVLVNLYKVLLMEHTPESDIFFVHCKRNHTISKYFNVLNNFKFLFLSAVNVLLCSIWFIIWIKPLRLK